ncbi:MAG: hypothetical protein JXR31_03595 [Prolixibacteraceae bacterium]|nr:hypothetical protein [Prolixibacteraceae bacterium]MBN2773308.1 hypothetical protein [Prolixibacteraceae bacterium]
MPRLITILFLLTGFVYSISAQDIFVSNLPVEKKDNALYFKFESASFFKNNEYESYVADGYTLTGTWLRPKFVYSPSNSVQLELGWHYLKFNGDENATWNLPWFSAKVGLFKNTQLIFGNLKNNYNHRLIQPVWEPERFLTDKPEAGFQFLHNSERLYFDAWINWEQFIVKGDPFQEHFTAGISSELNLSGSGKIRFSVPVQILFHHRGGEIDSSPLKVQTLSNMVGGLKAEIPASGIFKQVNLSGYYLTFNDGRGNFGLPFEKGSAFFSDISVDTKIGQIGFQIWSSDKFYAVKGMKLLLPGPFNSSANYDIWGKNLFSVYFDTQKEIINGIIFGARIEGWFESSLFSNTAAIYLIVNQDFLLKQF